MYLSLAYKIKIGWHKGQEIKALQLQVRLIEWLMVLFFLSIWFSASQGNIIYLPCHIHLNLLKEASLSVVVFMRNQFRISSSCLNSILKLHYGKIQSHFKLLYVTKACYTSIKKKKFYAMGCLHLYSFSLKYNSVNCLT